MADMRALELWAESLLAKLEPAARRRLLLDMARQLRARNSQRMAGQQTPDGEKWEPRKAQGDGLRNKRAQIRARAKARRPLFAKLRMQRWLKAKAQGDAAVVQFAGRADRIARVHHYGEQDRVAKNGPMYDYPERQLLGIPAEDADLLRDVILRHLHP